MDFVSARMADGRRFRTLTALDVYTREALALVVNESIAIVTHRGKHVENALNLFVY